MPRDNLASETGVYEIVVRGQPAASTAAWLGDLVVVSLPGGDCLLRSGRIDQAALYGLVARMRDLALVLVSISRVSEGEGEMGQGTEARAEG